MDSPDDRDGAGPRAEEVFAALGLSRDEQLALARCGFVARESHGTGVRYKLRWRDAGRQRVKSLGGDPASAARVEAALAEVQESRRWRAEMRQCVADTRRVMRRTRVLIEELERQAAERRQAPRRQRRPTASVRQRKQALSPESLWASRLRADNRMRALMEQWSAQ